MKNILIFLAIASLAYSKAPTGDLLEGINPGTDGKIDVLTIFPHQDDETIFVAGTLIKMKRDPRVRVHIACFTLGDMSVAKDNLGISAQRLGEIRSSELRTAGKVIGADEVIQFDYHDQGLSLADKDELLNKVLDTIKSTGAEVIITYGPDGITAHPDHIILSSITTEAFRKSNAMRLYYVSLPIFSRPVYRIFGGKSPMAPTVRVDIKEVKKLKKLALDAHSTQKFFSGFWQNLEMELVFRYEYFTLFEEKARLIETD